MNDKHVELRWVVPASTHVPPSVPRLQYRCNNAPAMALPDGYSIKPQWSEWTDVPVHVEGSE